MKWFKHDTTSNMDSLLQEVLLDYGLEGYGLYWYCLELIAGKVEPDNLTFELKHDCRIIARNVGSTPQRVQEMMTRFIDMGLFENAEGKIYCMQLAKIADDYTTKLVKRNKGKLQLNQQLRESPTNSEKDSLEESKTKESKVEESKTEKDKKAVEQEEINKAFEVFWKAGMTKTNKKSALKKFTSLVQRSKENPHDFAEKLARDVKQRLANNQFGFSKLHPATYLNGERWNDEYTADTSGQTLSERVAAANGLSNQAAHCEPLAIDGEVVRREVDELPRLI